MVRLNLNAKLAESSEEKKINKVFSFTPKKGKVYKHNDKAIIMNTLSYHDTLS